MEQNLQNEQKELTTKLFAKCQEVRKIQEEVKNISSKHHNKQEEVMYGIDSANFADLNSLKNASSFYYDYYKKLVDAKKMAKENSADFKYFSTMSEKCYDISKILDEMIHELEIFLEKENRANTPATTKTEDAVRKNKIGLLKNIDEQYYEQIFRIINSTIVLGSKNKYNTLEYLENQIMTADVKRVKELGFPVSDIEKAHLIKGILIKFIEMSKDIRRDQWKPKNNATKVGSFEGRKHSAEEAVIDRNIRLMKVLHIGQDTAKKYGVAMSLADLEKDTTSEDKAKKLITKAKSDVIFNNFYSNFKTIYLLGEPTSANSDVLYKVYADLKDNKENNSFGLKGVSLKAAIALVEETIKTRRNNHLKGKKQSQKEIAEEQKELGM